MLKSALLCPTRPAREPRGPPGRGSEPPHPDAAPLQLPRRRKQQQKERVAAAPPPRATAQAPELPGLREAKWAKNPTPAQTPPKPSPIHPHSRTYMHRSEKLPGCAKEEGKHRGSGWAAAAPWATAAAAATASPPQFRPPPPQPPPVPLLGLGPLQPLHPPPGWRWEGWGEKRKGGGVAGKRTELLPTWSSQ